MTKKKPKIVRYEDGSRFNPATGKVYDPDTKKWRTPVPKKRRRR